MPKKAPRFQLANRVVILTFFLSALIVGFYQLTTRGIGVAWMGFIAVLYLLIPPLYRRIFHLKPTYLIDMVLMISSCWPSTWGWPCGCTAAFPGTTTPFMA